jgi:CBS domain-containing protein
MNVLSSLKFKRNNILTPSCDLLHAYQQLNVPLGNFDTSKHWTALPNAPIRDVLTEMNHRDSDAAVIVNEVNKLVGIFTKSDLLTRVFISHQNLDEPINTVMTPNPVALQTSALGYEAIVAMVQGGFHHVVLVEDGLVVGVISEHDLFTLQQVSLGQIAATINSADSLDKICQCALEIKHLIEYMFLQGVAPDQVTQIVSTLNDQLMRRVIFLETENENLSDIRVCWLIMGSEGRYEQTISTDQDNAIIFEHPKSIKPDVVRNRLLPVAKRVNHSLDSIGFPLCKGNVMAGNPSCCLSLAEWKKKFHAWILEPTPESLLSVSIYFDFRALHGHLDLADELRIWLSDVTRGQVCFLKNMTDVALQKSPPLSFINTFLQEDHPEVSRSTDIKVRGVNVFVDAARIYALASGITSTRTHNRFMEAAQVRNWPDSIVSAWTESFHFLQGLRIRHQHHLRNSGQTAHNRIDLRKLNRLEQKVCIESFKQARSLQKQLELDFIRNLMNGSVVGT